MNDFYLNRLNMGRKVYACLDNPLHVPLWEGQPPLRLTNAIAEGRVMLAGLENLAKQQGLDPTGSATDKAREEKELEDAAHELGRLVVNACRDAGDEAGAATFDLPISGWRRMRDETLLQTARSLEAKAGQIATTPKGAEYNITPAAVAALKKEADDYAALIVAPDDAIGGRAAVTKKIRPAFAAFEAKLQVIDDLILPLRRTEAGALFVAKYQEARTINDRGRRPDKDETPPPAPPAA
ncbi:MAG: hypothetical protein JNG86_10665 [Verrucomicrobiaceae bacterium]|nr:hypothetical protein [Verrucomicrobiaceae bacterium]